MQASEMSFLESKVFSIHGMLLRAELSVFDFLLSRRDLHATGFLLSKPDDARCTFMF